MAIAGKGSITYITRFVKKLDLFYRVVNNLSYCSIKRDTSNYTTTFLIIFMKTKLDKGNVVAAMTSSRWLHIIIFGKILFENINCFIAKAI